MDTISIEVFRLLKRLDLEQQFQMAPPLRSNNSNNFCRQESGGYVCTLSVGHDGVHVAHGDKALRIWINNEIANAFPYMDDMDD